MKIKPEICNSNLLQSLIVRHLDTWLNGVQFDFYSGYFLKFNQVFIMAFYSFNFDPHCITRIQKTITAIVLFTCIVLQPAIAEESGLYKKLIDTQSDAIVSIKAVLTIEIRMMGQAENEESRTELPGVMVNNSGLIMTSNQPFSGEAMGQIFRSAPGNVETDVSLTGITVVIKDESYNANLVATDSELGLAFIQLEDTENRTYSYVNFNTDNKPETGNPVYMLARLGEGFDFAPLVRKLVVSGEITRPRQAWIADIHAKGHTGLPVFSSDGSIAGVITSLQEAREEPTAGGGRIGLGRMFRSMQGETSYQMVLLSPETIQPLITGAENRLQER